VKQIRIALWVLIAAVLAVIGVLMLQKPDVQTAPPPMRVTTSFGGPFTLVGSDGKPFGTEQLHGKPYVLFFGFTHCPDTCPTTLARLVKLRREAGGDDAFNIVFVTVDPERDGPKEMGAYANAFGAPIIGLTGSPEQIAKVKKEFGIFSKKVPTGDGDYTVDHTATVLLFDSDGKFVATIAPDEPDAPALAKLKRMEAA
jgi:protein SCO1/2